MAIFKEQIDESIDKITLNNKVSKEWAYSIFFSTEMFTIFQGLKEDAKEKLYDWFIKYIPEQFKSEIFTIKEACDILMFNAESLRRKIRKNALPTENKEEVGGRIGYKISGNVIIDSCTQIYQKENLIKYCISRYFSESAIAFFRIIIDGNIELDEDMVENYISLIVGSLSIIKTDPKCIPEIKLEDTDFNLRESYIDFVEEMKKNEKKKNEKRMLEYNTKFRNNTFVKKEYNTLEELERHKLELELEEIDIDIKIVELKLEKTDIQEEKIKILESRIELEKKKSSVKEKLINFGKVSAEKS